MFEGVSGMMGPRLDKGHKLTYPTRLRQRGHAIHLWKLEFTDGKDEVLVCLTMDSNAAGKYSGILFQ